MSVSPLPPITNPYIRPCISKQDRNAIRLYTLEYYNVIHETEKRIKMNSYMISNIKEVQNNISKAYSKNRTLHKEHQK